MSKGAAPAVIIFAPTASGKTDLVLDLFGASAPQPLGGCAEVISADSQAVYKGLDKGTAKPSAQEQKEIFHHLVDVASLNEQFGVGEFVKGADKACADILSRKKLPLVVGGTGFYIRSFLLGLPKTPEANRSIRELLQNRLKTEGKEVLYAELAQIDKKSAQKIHPNDEYRILRALEVFYSSAKPLSSYTLPQETRKEYSFLTIILTRPRDELYKRIDERIDKMLAAGLYEEVLGFKEQGLNPQNTPALKAIGYSEFFLENLSFSEIVQKIKHDSHRYAKKQYTYMRDIPNATVVDAGAPCAKDTVRSLVMDFLSA